MEMNNEKTIEINRIPSLTWNWMKMNKDLLTLDFSLTSLNPEISMPAAGSDFNKADVATALTSNNGFTVFSSESPAFASVAQYVEERKAKFEHKIESAAGEEIAKIIEETSKSTIITANGNIEKPLYLNFNLEKDSHTASSQIVYALPNSECTLIYTYESEDDEPSFSALRTQIFLEEGAKVHVIKVQLLGNESHQIDETSFLCGERAEAKFTQIELGGKHVDSGVNTTLSGYKSNFTSNVGYLCTKEQFLDMNHVVLHKGKKTECDMRVDGTLKNKAVKNYRGTIDFKNGCSGSKGNEMEETLLLTPTVVNKSLPVILCDEEDVEGEHGATLGRLSGDILFYMQNRGIDIKAAEKLMAKAKIQKTSANIPDEDLCKKISSFINKKL